MNKNLLKTLAALIAPALTWTGLTLPIAAQAGQFSVSPVRIFMTQRDRATAITLTNEGDTELVMQADLHDWTQGPDGEDQLTLSEDMILSPPIIKLAPRSRQVLRLALLRPVPLSTQRTFRLIVREIPEAQVEENKVKLQIAMAFSLPVFISPSGAKRDLDCNTSRRGPATVQVSCINLGNAYAQPLEIALTTPDGQPIASSQTPAYLLAGTRRSFQLSAPADLPSGRARLTVRQDEGQLQTFEVTLAD